MKCTGLTTALGSQIAPLPGPQIPCRGRGQAPEPEAVNDFVWEVASQKVANATVLVHCTHGFNRTGYMIVSYCVRMHGWTVEKALYNFALARPPGIYKHYYIRQGGRGGSYPAEERLLSSSLHRAPIQQYLADAHAGVPPKNHHLC